MKYIVIISLFVYLTVFQFVIDVNGQSRSRGNVELGILAGVSYYMGDVNPEKVFYSPGPVFGGFYKYNFNPRYSAKLSGLVANLSADDADFNNEYQQIRDHHFSTKLTDIALQAEFNFLTLNPGDDKRFWTPYITGGVAAFLVMNQSESLMKFAIPFGIGVKICPSKRLSLGLEWTMRKTYYDYIDQLEASYTDEYDGVYRFKQKSFAQNDDYYSIAYFFISYKIFNSKFTCPAFAQPFNGAER